MDTVRVTLLLPIRNGEKYLRNALANCEANAGKDDEVLIIDDNSEDHTFELSKKWCIDRPAFRVLRNPGTGLVDALNYGIEQSNGEWVARFDADDYYSDNRLDKQMEQVDKATVAIFSDYTFRTVDGRFMGDIRSAVIPFATELSVLSSQRLAHPVALLNKSAVREAGGYLNSEFPTEDLGLWLRLMEFGTFKSVPEQLLDYSISTSSISGSRRQLMLKTQQRVLSNPLQVRNSIDKLNPTLINIFKLYKHTNFYWERTLFFLRDLKIAKSKNFLTRQQSIAVNIALIIMFMNPFTFVLILKHFHFKKLRAQLRRR